MIRKFFDFGQKNTAAPDVERLYAVGDIHGRLDLLDTLLEKIAADGGETAPVIFLGDYVDRGPDSAGVLARLADLQTQRPDYVFLKGNHEAAMLDFLHAPDAFPEWLDWGGEETLKSYGVPDVMGRSHDWLAGDLQQKMAPAHRDFLESLNLWHMSGDYVFVHAGLRPGVPLEDQVEEDLLWIRKRFHNAGDHERPEQTVVHGHQPVKKPQDAGWRINVDTGAVWSDHLTAVVLEGTSRRFLST